MQAFYYESVAKHRKCTLGYAVWACQNAVQTTGTQDLPLPKKRSQSVSPKTEGSGSFTKVLKMYEIYVKFRTLHVNRLLAACVQQSRERSIKNLKTEASCVII